MSRKLAHSTTGKRTFHAELFLVNGFSQKVFHVSQFKRCLTKSAKLSLVFLFGGVFGSPSHKKLLKYFFLLGGADITKTKKYDTNREFYKKKLNKHYIMDANSFIFLCVPKARPKNKPLLIVPIILNSGKHVTRFNKRHQL